MQVKGCQLVHFLHQHWVERETPETEDELIHNLEANLFMSNQHRANPASRHTPNERNSDTTSDQLQHEIVHRLPT